MRLAETRARVGVANDQDVEVAQANVGSYRDALRQVELAREQALRALEILIGRYPAAAVAVSARLPGQPDAVPAGLPSELLERRPDVVAAERRVAAAFNRVGEAKAARLPTIALTTGVSSISSDLFVLQNHDNPVWNVGASLLAPIYKGGALKTQVEIQTAEQKQAIAAYASIGLRAFGEVENALASEIAARDRERILTRNAVTQPARPRYRADAVQGRQHRSSLRQRAAARPQHDERGPHPRAGRAAGAARQPSPGAWRQLRSATRTADRRAAEEEVVDRPFAARCPQLVL